MDRISKNIIGFISRFKYSIVLVVGFLVVGLIDENSFIKLFSYYYQIEDLKKEVKEYNNRYENDTKQLRAMKRDSKAIARIARERYFMKADNEDIFVLSDEEHSPNSNRK